MAERTEGRGYPPRTILAGALVGLALAAVGCGGGGQERPARGEAADGEGAAAAPAGEPAHGPDWEVADTVNVRLTEYRIQMPRTLPPGPTVFRVTNSGAVDHNLEIRGQGVSESFGIDLPPARTRGLRVLLAPGRYRVICPVGDHVFRGMLVELTVTEG